MDKALILIAKKYFEGQTSQEEEIILFDWINKSNENLKEFQALEESFKKTYTPSVASLAALYRAKAKIKTTQRNNRGWWIAVLATPVAAAIALFFILQHGNFASKEIDLVAQQYTLEAQNGTRSKLSLPDGSIVWLNAGSSLQYGDDFNQTSRAIHLTGEAYFEVAHNPDIPFVISNNCNTYTVLGTKFCVSSYESDLNLKIALAEGSLRVDTPAGTNIMAPGELVEVDKDSGVMKKTTTDISQYFSWVNGTIKYSSIYAPELFARISREFNVDIVLNTDLHDDRELSVSFKHSDNISDIFTALSRILPCRIEKINNTYYIY